MNGSRLMATDLASAIARAPLAEIDVLLCPPHAYLGTVADALSGSRVLLGGQDCSEYASGAYTGETAAGMLRDCGCSHVIIGHSERRQWFGDTATRAVAKVQQAHAAGLVSVFCVGETLAERRAGATEAAIEGQLAPLLEAADAAHLLPAVVIAYEPVWAIGTGETATPAQAQAVHAWIRARAAQVQPTLAPTLRIVYGGSVKPDNAAELFAMPDIDGGLVGGAALEAPAFLAICRAVA